MVPGISTKATSCLEFFSTSAIRGAPVSKAYVSIAVTVPLPITEGIITFVSSPLYDVIIQVPSFCFLYPHTFFISATDNVLSSFKDFFEVLSLSSSCINV